MRTTHQWIQGVLILGALGLSATAEARNSQRTEAFQGTWSGDMVCGTGQNQLASERHLKITNTVVTYTQGTPGYDGYEALTGTVDPTGALLIQGTYQWEETKGIWFYGQIKDQTLRATGWRGRNWCQLDLIKTSHIVAQTKAGV